MLYHVVVDDPGDEFQEGSLIAPDRARMLEARGMVSLPADPELFRVSGVGGFYKRAWGAGWPLNSTTPRFFCPITLYVTRSHHQLSWAARLVVDPTVPERDRFVGLLRLTVDTAQPSAMTGGFVGNDPRGNNLVDVSRLGPPTANGGWIVRGDGRIQSTGEGFLALGLYGMAPGLAIQWLAVGVAM